MFGSGPTTVVVLGVHQSFEYDWVEKHAWIDGSIIEREQDPCHYQTEAFVYLFVSNCCLSSPILFHV